MLSTLAFTIYAIFVLLFFLACDESLGVMKKKLVTIIPNFIILLRLVLFRCLSDLIILLVIISFLSWVLFVDHPFRDKELTDLLFSINPIYFSQLGDFIAGLPVLILSFASLLLVVRSNKERRKSEAESTFFTLLNANIELVKNLTYRDKDGDYSGVDVIRKFYNLFFVQNFDVNLLSDTKDNHMEIIRTYEKIYDELICEYLGHYFRNVYHLFVAIDKSNVSKTEKMRLSNIFLSNFSNSQLVMLLLNSQSQYGKNMAPLVEKYNAFENLKEFNPKTSVNFFLRMTKLHTALLNDNKFIGDDLNLFKLRK